jgi:DNA-binding transcriptional MerR regulator
MSYYIGMAYSLGELARLAGVSPRTVRFYIARGLIPRASGRGRGPHYGEDHLWRLVAIRALRGQGVELRLLRERLRALEALDDTAVEVWADPGWSPPAEAPHWVRLAHARLIREVARRAERAGAVARTAWTRVELAPGLELHVSSAHTLPQANRLQTLALDVREAFGL